MKARGLAAAARKQILTGRFLIHEASNVQAVSPFMDTVTQKKIHFCDKGAKGDAIMAKFFHMDQMDECMGGKGPAQFNYEDYERQQLAEKASVNGYV